MYQKNRPHDTRDSTDPRYDLFDRLVRIAAIYKSDIMWRDYTKMSEEEDI